jgi:hypothetical protein
MVGDSRNFKRRQFGYYMQVFDEKTQKLIGHMADISEKGFRVDSPSALPVGTDFRVRLDLNGEVADKSFMVFVARAKWCKPDTYEPNSYNVGFEVINISPTDNAIFQRIVAKYGR